MTHSGVSRSVVMSTPDLPVHACLDALPDELVLRILEFARDQGMQLEASFVNFSHTSRRFNRLSYPFMYERYAIERGLPGRFVRSIITTPDVARCVKHIEWEHLGGGREQGTSGELAQVDRQLLGSKVLELGTRLIGDRLADDLAMLLEAVPEEDESYLASALIFTEHIESLKVVDGRNVDRSDQKEHRYWTDTIRFGSPHSFRHLRRATVDATRMHLDDLMPLILLPSMRKVDLHGLVETAADDPPANIRYLGLASEILASERFIHTPADDDHLSIPTRVHSPALSGRSNIEHFGLHNCSISSQLQASLIALFRKLESYEYDNEGLGNPYSKPRAYMDLRFITESLHQHCETLRHFSFIAAKFSLSHTANRFSSMQEFEKLKSLSLPCYAHGNWMEVLSPISIALLPPNVEALTLNFDLAAFEPDSACHFYEPVLNPLDVLVRTGNTRLKQLRKVQIVGSAMLERYLEENLLRNLHGCEVEVDFVRDNVPVLRRGSGSAISIP